MAVLPLIMGQQGLQPQSPASLRDQLVNKVAATNPDYTANLPGTLIEDIVSTDIAAVIESDSFLVDLINSVTPFGANAFILAQFGELYGLTPQVATNTSVYVIFTGPPGFVIVQGFVVGDGTYQYICQDGGIIGTDQESLPIYAISNSVGSWAVPAGSINQLITSVPSSIINAGFSVTNPADGIPSSSGESISDYHDRVMTAGLASSTGMARYLRTLVANIPGVVTRLVSVKQDIPTGRYVAIVGGGDPYQVAYALSKAMFWVIGFLSAPLNISGIDLTNPAVIHTQTNHNLVTGMFERIDDVVANGSLQTINGKTFVVTVIDGKTFSVPYDATLVGNIYISGGIITPNPIVEQVTITDYPDIYLIPYVIPAAENVAMTVTWQTNSPNYISQIAMAQAAGPSLLDYINSIPAGITPININVMTSIFLESVSDILPQEAITDLNFAVSINGVGVLPDPGTNIISGDPYSYFLAELSDIVVIEG